MNPKFAGFIFSWIIILQEVYKSLNKLEIQTK